MPRDPVWTCFSVPRTLRDKNKLGIRIGDISRDPVWTFFPSLRTLRDKKKLGIRIGDISRDPYFLGSKFLCVPRVPYYLLGIPLAP
jgi:hypothetical protein